MKKRKNKQFILIMIVILVITLGIVVFFIDKNKPKAIQNSDTVIPEIDRPVLEEVKKEFLQNEQILPDRETSYIRLYTGNADPEGVYAKLYQVVYQEIPKLKKALDGKSKSDIKNYYENNYSEVYEILGLDEYEDFENFVEKIQSIKNTTFNNAYFDIENSYLNSDEDLYSIIKLVVKFQEDSIVFDLHLINEIEEQKPTFKFLIAK